MTKTGSLQGQATAALDARRKSTEPDERFRPVEAARYINVSLKCFRQKLYNGEISYLKLSRRCVRIEKSALDAYLAAARVPAREDAA